MNTRAEKTEENTSKSVANGLSKIQGDGSLTLEFVDNRPEAIAQRKLKVMADNYSPQQKPFREKEHTTDLMEARVPGSGVSIQRKLILNGNEKNSPLDAQNDLGADYNDSIQNTIQELITLPGPPVKVTTDDLKQVHAYRTNKTVPANRAAKVATLQLLSNGSWTHTGTVGLNALRTLEVWNEPSMLENVERLGKFLNANPKVGENLKAAGAGWELRSKHQQIEDFGGGAVIEDRIHISDWVLKERGPGFMRMAVHEAGHATFQRLLLTGENWTEAVNLGKEDPHEKALEVDGKKFYEAWRVIRQKPEYFYRTKMPGNSPASTEKGRGEYLANQFSEFCAESFMHLALMKNELQQHVQNLPDMEPAIKAAWQDALGILLKNETQILGNQAGDGGASLQSHKMIKMESDRRNSEFVAAVKELAGAMKGPQLAVVKAEDVAAPFQRLQLAWHGLNDFEQGQHRLVALRTLDEYILKVQRRRPAEANLGSQLGFANL